MHLFNTLGQVYIQHMITGAKQFNRIYIIYCIPTLNNSTSWWVYV